MLDKKIIEEAVIIEVRKASTGCSPFEVRMRLEQQGWVRGDIRDAIARLLDYGSIKIDTNLRLHLFAE